MDFDDTQEEAQFRAQVRAWLEVTAKPKSTDVRNSVSFGRDKSEAELLKEAKAWQAKKADARYAQITWPEELGGRGGTSIQSVIYNQEEEKFDVPRGFFEIGLGMCIPTMMTWATDEQKQRFVSPALRGEEIWCQLFSEPAAGSDLAGITMKAVQDGEHWIINGQKVWTSGAHYSDYGIVVARSDPNVPKHKGLTFFFLDMKSPGIEVRPIRQLSGSSNFNEVFFTDVRIPDSQRLGAVGEGWKVSLTTLLNERLAIGGGTAGPDFEEILALAQQTLIDGEPAARHGAVRDKLADWYVRSMGLKYTRYRTLTALSRGETPGPEASIGKVVTAPKLQELTSFAMDLQDMGGIITDGDLVPLEAGFQQYFMWAPGMRIAGGTDEILRNIIAERVLGLPQDVRVDKKLPFSELPKGV